MKTITLIIPATPSFSPVLSNTKNYLRSFTQTVVSAIHAFTDYVNTETSEKPKVELKIPQNLRDAFQNNKKNLKFVPFAAVALVLMVAVGLFLRGSDRTVLGKSDTEKLSLEKPLAEQNISKNFSFPVLDSTGKEAGKLQYTVEKAEFRDQLIIKGQQARAVDGRTFLIISLKLKNDTKNAISVNTRDFIRLKREGSDELLAPTIHNDPVEAQAISTLTTRVGFSIDEENKDNLSLQIGEIRGDKQTVDLNLK